MSVPLHVCAHPGCTVMVPFNQRYCSQHKAKPQGFAAVGYDRYSHRKAIGGKYFRFYKSKQWTKMSKLYRYQHPVCEHCLKLGLYVQANVVDHKIPIRTAAGWQQRLDPGNLQSLCHTCHNKKTQADERRYKFKPLE